MIHIMRIFRNKNKVFDKQPHNNLKTLLSVLCLNRIGYLFYKSFVNEVQL